MKRARLLIATEKYLEGTLAPDEKAALTAAVRDDPEARAAFAAQVLMARRLRALLGSARTDLWERIAPLVGDGAHEAGRQEEVARAVEARLRKLDARPRWRLGFALGVMAAAAAAALILWVRSPSTQDATAMRSAAPALPSGEPSATERPFVPEPAVTDRRAAAVEPPGPATAVEPPPVAAAIALSRRAARGAGWRAQMLASEGPAFASRPDVLLYAAFEDRGPLAVRVRRRLANRAAFVPGMAGQALRVRYPGAYSAGEDEPVRIALAVSDPAVGAGAARIDEAHLRYYVRLGDAFAFGQGGILPGLAGAGARQAHGNRWKVRPRWDRNGELAFDGLPDVPPRSRRWRRALRRGTWHALELRVKLNTPGAQDGVVQAWVDGDQVASVESVAFRDRPDDGIDRVLFETGLGGSPLLRPDIDGEALFDNLALCAGYVGPSAAR